MTVPLIADVHFSTAAAFEALLFADKVRLNPGNLLDSKLHQQLAYEADAYEKELSRIEAGLLPFITAAKQAHKPIRIGANHGSLSDRILSRYGDTPLGMVESAMEYLRIFQKYDYRDIVVAMKAADPLIMIEANRLLIATLDREGMDYPIHLGVTEAGNAEDGRAKSTIGIGTALLEGIGDTIRVSLTEAPEKELPVCYSILQATRRRITKTEFISCPSCGRTLFDLETVTNKVKERLGHMAGLRIAVMGCIVNGIGEMADADFGYVGGKPGMINLFWKKDLVRRDVPEAEALDVLVELIKEKGAWVEKK
jgi:(E)-4-hydroxy-3-methylbut-2-enyl-diphosphate synthase